MAKKETPTASKAPPLSAEEPQNKAQAEFQRYMKRMQAQPAGAASAFMTPVSFLSGGEAMPGWAVPPSVAMLPNTPGSAGFFVPMTPGMMSGQGSLTHRLGSTLHLGVDVINAALASGIRLLNGISGEESCGCEACGGSDCGCCGSDCCGGCESCCRPSVGSCC